MHEYGAGKYELLDLKVAQPAQQPFGAAHGYLLKQGTRLTRETIVRREIEAIRLCPSRRTSSNAT